MEVQNQRSDTQAEFTTVVRLSEAATGGVL